MQETQVQALGQEDPLEKEMATHSSILTWEITWTESLASFSPWSCKRVRHNLVTEHTHSDFLGLRSSNRHMEDQIS